jgi:hypothetical protein
LRTRKNHSIPFARATTIPTIRKKPKAKGTRLATKDGSTAPDEAKNIKFAMATQTKPAIAPTIPATNADGSFDRETCIELLE